MPIWRRIEAFVIYIYCARSRERNDDTRARERPCAMEVHRIAARVGGFRIWRAALKADRRLMCGMCCLEMRGGGQEGGEEDDASETGSGKTLVTLTFT